MRLVERVIFGAGCGALCLSGHVARVAQISGEYFENRLPGGASPKAKDVNLRRKLWDISAQLVGLPEVR